MITILNAAYLAECCDLAESRSWWREEHKWLVRANDAGAGLIGNRRGVARVAPVMTFLRRAGAVS